MKPPTLQMTGPVPVAEIETRDRIRPVSEAGVAAIIASITDTGVMKDAIHVRRKKGGVLVLIAGAHRLESAKRLGWETIEAKVWVEVTDDWSRLMEIDDNLAGAELTALDTAVFLARRKEVYERLHPETKRGVAGAKGRWDATDIESVASFAAATRDKFGLAERHVFRLIAAGSKLGPDEVARLREAPRPVTLKDLADIARIGGAAERYEVVRRLSEGRARSAAEALRAYRAAEQGVEKPPETAFDLRLKALLASWNRAGVAVRRAFVEEVFAELSPLVVAVAEVLDAAEVAGIRQLQDMLEDAAKVEEAAVVVPLRPRGGQG